ncbi:hypothetical protein [Vibrio sp. ER1A]|uniref:hypothetical protein n=1 Tax=Vibrio sp. ER1A TaxID=1517681 RepID=UPI000691547F|nr:hypothetical protein [Vibrio sp. ER1A]
MNTRHVYAAFGDENNELRYGKTDGSLGLITDFTDIFYSYGGEAQAKLKTADRAANQLLYVGTFGALTVKANANGGGQDYKYEKGGQKVGGQIRYGLGLAAKYDIGSGFAVGASAAYEDINKGTVLAATNLKGNASEYVGGLSYTNGALYLGTGINYTEVVAKDIINVGDVKASSTGWELVGKYQFTDKWQGIAGYSDTSFDSTPSTDVDNDSFVSAELSYEFAPSMVTYAGIEYGLSGEKHDDSLAGRVGAKVTF